MTLCTTWAHTTTLKIPQFPWRNRRLPSPTRINSSVHQSIRTCLQVKCLAEKGTSPTDSDNHSLKIMNQRES
jgi:hypothetical protein